jgi:hypothetical protein
MPVVSAVKRWISVLCDPTTRRAFLPFHDIAGSLKIENIPLIYLLPVPIEEGKRVLKTAGQAACAIGSASAGRQFQGMRSSQREAGQSPATLAITSAI